MSHYRRQLSPANSVSQCQGHTGMGTEGTRICDACCYLRFCQQCQGRGWVGQILPVAMKRCVASSSCGEIFTLISESESLNREKSCRLLSRCGTLCFFRLSAIGAQGKVDTQNHCWSLEAYTDSLGPPTFCSANCRRHDPLSPSRRQAGSRWFGVVCAQLVDEKGKSCWGGGVFLSPEFQDWLPYLIAVQTLCISNFDCFNPYKRALIFSSFSTCVVNARSQ